MGKLWPLGLIVPVQDPTPFSAFSPAEWPESLARVHREGYEAVELAITDPTKLRPSELREALKKANLKWIAVTTGQAFWKEGLSLSSPDQRIWEKAVERFKAHMALAETFGAVVIVGLLRGKDGEKTRFLEALRECVGYRPQVRLALEPLNRYETSLVNTVREALEILDSLGAENLGLLFDTFHANIEEASFSEPIRIAGDRIFHVHLADSNRFIPGFGHIPFPDIWRALEDVGYRGGLVLECLPKPHPQALFPADEVKRRVGLGDCPAKSPSR
ncbi:sugar phosphate isomerase/epimerase [Candidatus Bipolaricaulota bacterium]|nr:sugar phosphate isomerase/epimerase [Candidatus Bipolaricaulota bacterium]